MARLKIIRARFCEKFFREIVLKFLAILCVLTTNFSAKIAVKFPQRRVCDSFQTRPNSIDFLGVDK